MKLKKFKELSTDNKIEYTYYWKDKLKIKNYLTTNTIIKAWGMTFAYISLLLWANQTMPEILPEILLFGDFFIKIAFIMLSADIVLQVLEFIRYFITNKKYKEWLNKSQS